MREKSCYDFDSADDYYDYLNGLTDDNNETDREPDDDEPVEQYDESQDRNYMSTDVRFMN